MKLPSEIMEKMRNKSKVLKPAIAGLIVDHAVDYKEIFATFVDLVVKGHVAFSSGRKFFRTEKGGLCPFEGFLLDSVFFDKKPLQEKEVIERLKNFDIKDFSIMLLDELVEQGIADEGAKMSLSSEGAKIEASSGIELMGTDETPEVLFRKKETVSHGLLGRLFGAGKSKPQVTKTVVGHTWEQRGSKDSGLPDRQEIEKRLMQMLESAKTETNMPIEYDQKQVSGFAEQFENKLKETKQAAGEPARMKNVFRLPNVSKITINGKEVKFENLTPKQKAIMEKMAKQSPEPVKGAAAFEFKQTEKAKALIAEYKALQDFLARFPLQEDRFSNEFIAFNIAFRIRNAQRLPG